jgi:hypothetical protein
MLGSRKQMRIIGINGAEVGLGRSCSVEGVSGTQRHSGWERLINLPDEREHVFVLHEPKQCPVLDVGSYLVDKGGVVGPRLVLIGYGPRLER